MTTIALTITIIAMLMLAMSVGVIFSNRELKGSCGGVGSCACEDAGLPKECELVPGPGQPRRLPDAAPSCQTGCSVAEVANPNRQLGESLGS